MKKQLIFLFLLILGVFVYYFDGFYYGFDKLFGSFIAFLLVCLGIYLLVSGGDYLVIGSVSVAKKFKISPLVIGLTIVSFGTSAPEFFINVLASFKGNTDLLLSNIIGSNLANLLLILGISAIVSKKVIKVKDSTLFKEIPFSFLAALVLFFMVNDKFIDGFSFNVLSRIDGLLLLCFFVIFIYYVFSLIKSDKGKIAIDEEIVGIKQAILFIIFGIFGLYLGGELVVDNASFLAKELGVSNFLIGATIVAIGTSLPELIASAFSAARGHADMAIGNVIGSNIFNIFWIGGVSAVIHPVPFQTKYEFDIIFLILATLFVLLTILFDKKRSIGKFIGFVYILLYIFYVGFVIYRG